MKSYFKIIIFTLISCCYFNTVFELSDNEKKENFGNETHSYIQQESLNTTYSKIVLQLDKVITINKQTEATNPVIVCISDNNYKTGCFLLPPEHRYILYSSLII